MNDSAELARLIESAWASCMLTAANASRTFFAEGFQAGHAARDSEVAELRERCAKVAEETLFGTRKTIAAAIRAIK